MKIATLPKRGFFADKNQAFWILQIGGWAFYFLLRTLGGLANSMGIAFIVPTLIVTVTGFSLTMLMSAAFRRIIRMRPAFVWTLTLLIVAVASAIFSVLEVWAHARFYDPTFQPRGIQFFGAILLDMSVLIAWTGLYYGINYYLLLDEQSERVLVLSGQASAAQLAMLRYQLNPHFLFNTLNSISTLVLLKETDRANTMLSRLSSFLRYSLVSDPTETVSLAQELEALKLYFEIERMRFEDRLKTRFDIDPAALQGRLPSLLLQPLVENCIKYAVTPQEEGAEIVIAAHVSGDRLMISVSDNGPGLNAERSALTQSAGVGLNNIRDRLFQTYGDDHRFEMLSNVPQGVVATIEIPFEPASARLKEAVA
jgi:two-component system, LytTR family, sensor kinase